MRTVRVIPRLDIKGPNLVKGIHLEGLRVLGKPEEFAKYYHYYLLIAAFLLALLYTSFHYNSSKQFLFIIAFIPIFIHLNTVYKNKDTTKLDPELKKLALSTFLFAVLFGLGQVL